MRESMKSRVVSARFVGSGKRRRGVRPGAMPSPLSTPIGSMSSQYKRDPRDASAAHTILARENDQAAAELRRSAVQAQQAIVLVAASAHDLGHQCAQGIDVVAAIQGFVDPVTLEAIAIVEAEQRQDRVDTGIGSGSDFPTGKNQRQMRDQ